MKEKPKNNRDTASSWVCVFIKQVPTRFKHILHEESSKNTSDTMYMLGGDLTARPEIQR